MSYKGGMYTRHAYPKCKQCGGVANAGGCNGCEYWYCKEHIYRHSGCSEGR